jgi:monoamine oxidase
MSASDIIIVGAGAAGIAAARWLRGQGYSTQILEARERLGGRAWTDTSKFGFPVDMGCAWLHSADLNPWRDIAVQAGFDVIERTPTWQRHIGREEATPEYLAAWRAAFDRNETLIEEAARSGRDVPVSQLVPNDRHRPMFDAVMTWLMGVDSPRVSSVDFARYADTNVNWAVREGLGTVVAHAARDLDVQLRTPVQRIDWSGERVRVLTARGTLEAAAVIIAVPTPILADEQSLRFVPSLSQPFYEAFNGVPLGIANKVFFELQPGAMPFDGATHMVGTDKTLRTGAYQTRPSGQEILLAYFGGDLARELEQRGQLEAFAREQLIDIFGADFGEKIRRASCTAWASDPYSRGAYSAALPGNAHRREQLNVAVAERLYFAGEACSIESFGTIHGAWRSGVEAAKRALEAVSSRTSRSP